MLRNHFNVTCLKFWSSCSSFIGFQRRHWPIVRSCIKWSCFLWKSCTASKVGLVSVTSIVAVINYCFAMLSSSISILWIPNLQKIWKAGRRTWKNIVGSDTDDLACRMFRYIFCIDIDIYKSGMIQETPKEKKGSGTGLRGYSLPLSIYPGTDKAGIRRFDKWLEAVNSLWKHGSVGRGVPLLTSSKCTEAWIKKGSGMSSCLSMRHILTAVRQGVNVCAFLMLLNNLLTQSLLTN